jgi:hypothetical protein
MTSVRRIGFISFSSRPWDITRMSEGIVIGVTLAIVLLVLKKIYPGF